MRHLDFEVRKLLASLIILTGMILLFAWQTVDYHYSTVSILKEIDQVTHIVLSSSLPFVSVTTIIYALVSLMMVLTTLTSLIRLNKKLQNQRQLINKYKQAIRLHQKQ